jgi:hypothetical protein
MSKTALIEALKAFDVATVKQTLANDSSLVKWRSPQGFDLLQFCCSRCTVDRPQAAAAQLRMAKWLIGHGFDPFVIHTTKVGEDGEPNAAQLPLVFFSVARAQNNALTRYFLKLGVQPSALFAAAWWGNAAIIGDLVAHGENVNRHVGATALHMAVAVLERGINGKPALAKQRLACLTALLKHGADPTLADDGGETPLHLALEKGYDVAVLRLLIRYGADPDQPNRKGRSVRDIASRKKDKRYYNALAS